MDDVTVAILAAMYVSQTNPVGVVRPLKSHDFVVRLTLFSSISRSDDETGKSHDKQRKNEKMQFLV